MRSSYRFVGASLTLFILSAAVRASSIVAGEGVNIDQVSFRGGDFSTVAQVQLDRSTLSAATGQSSGFVNIADASGNWVVRNLPMFSAAQSDASLLTTDFNIGGATAGTSISNLNLSVDFSTTPLQTYSGGPSTSFSLGQTVNAVGGGPDPVSGYRNAGNPNALTFGVPGFSLTYQFGHDNVQAATNQCAPAAVANSLSWLANTQGLNVPNDNVPGLRSDVSEGDESLVGELEKDMNRNVTSRTEGDGVWPLDGKLQYLSDTGLASDLIIKHAGGGDSGQGALSGKDNFTDHGVTSYGAGNLTWQWIHDELAEGEDVELEYSFVNGGAHYVDVTGAGMIAGIPFITHISDQEQTDSDPNDELGTDSVQFDFMLGDYLTSENAHVVQAISQSIVPEPSTVWGGVSICLFAAASLWRRFRSRK